MTKRERIKLEANVLAVALDRYWAKKSYRLPGLGGRSWKEIESPGCSVAMDAYFREVSRWLDKVTFAKIKPALTLKH